MLYCMALTTPDLVFLSSEIRRVLKLGRLNIYTVRNTTDAHYRTGVHRGEGLWEVGGFIVHFFSRQKVEVPDADPNGAPREFRKDLLGGVARVRLGDGTLVASATIMTTSKVVSSNPRMPSVSP